MFLTRFATRITRTQVAAFVAILIASAATVSAHVVRGLISPTAATAFVSSPTSGTDVPIAVRWSSGTAVVDAGRVVCFYVANSSTPRVDRPEWPRVTSVGFELPGSLSGFSLIDPTDGWELVEGTRAFLPGHGLVTLDFAIVARFNPPGWFRQPVEPRGIPPGQPTGIRGQGTRFCVNGPFPDTLPSLLTEDPLDTTPTSIEGLLNGVVVGFHGVYGNPAGFDAGVWESPLRAIPLYPTAP